MESLVDRTIIREKVAVSEIVSVDYEVDKQIVQEKLVTIGISPEETGGF
jgi:hypothetical protein